jgi:hypothetical protein
MGQRNSWQALTPPEGQTCGGVSGLQRRAAQHGDVGAGAGAGRPDDDEGIFVARQQARARVEPGLPVFAVSPEQAVVRFPTWLWLDESYWQPAGASTTPSG